MALPILRAWFSEILRVREEQVEEVEVLKVLGSMVSNDGSEKAAYEHKIQRAWAGYWK